jgi:hypothetical protein
MSYALFLEPDVYAARDKLPGGQAGNVFRGTSPGASRCCDRCDLLQNSAILSSKQQAHAV